MLGRDQFAQEQEPCLREGTRVFGLNRVAQRGGEAVKGMITLEKAAGPGLVGDQVRVAARSPSGGVKLGANAELSCTSSGAIILPMGAALAGAAVPAGSQGYRSRSAGRDGMEAGTPEGLTDGAAGTWADIIAPRISIDAFMKVTPDHGPSPARLLKQTGPAMNPP